MAAPNRARAIGHPRAEDLRSLAASAAEPCVSIYVPIDVAVPLARKNPVRYAQAIDTASRRLDALGVDPDRIRAWRERLETVDTGPRSFVHPTRSLAVFLNDDGLHAFGLEPPLDTQVYVGSRFALRPLLQAARRHRPYRLLAMSLNRVALFEGDAHGLRETSLEGLPKSLVDALGSDVEVETLQLHHGMDRGLSPIYHGHGGGADERSRDLERFHLAVTKPLVDAFRTAGEPFVIASDQTHQGPMHEALAPIPGLLRECVQGNPDGLAPHELHARAWPLIEQVIEREERDAAADFERARNQGKGTDDLQEAARAAVAGRVRRLWIPADRRVPGHVDESEARIAEPTADEDALDELAVVVLRRGGEVLVTDAGSLPTRTSVAAQLW